MSVWTPCTFKHHHSASVFMDGILIIKNQPGSVLCSHEVAARRTGMGEFPGDLDKDSAAYVF